MPSYNNEEPRNMGDILSKQLNIPRQHLNNLTPAEFKELIPQFERILGGVIFRGLIGAYFIMDFYLDKDIPRFQSGKIANEPGYCGQRFPMTFNLHLNDRLVPF